MMRFRCFLLMCLFVSMPFLVAQNNPTSGEKQDWEAGRPDGCTTITVGLKAMVDGSVVTSHTCDSHRTRGSLDIMPKKNFPAGDSLKTVKRTNCDTTKMPTYMYVPTGYIPQVESTFGYINTAYPAMNEVQLAIGESTFGGRDVLRSDAGLIDCQQLVHLMLQRCKTAREAILLAGDLLAKYGYNDEGECLTIADTKEVWHFEVVGPGKGNIGAIWVAQRVPDGHVSVNANASRIRQIDLKDSGYFLASENVHKMAIDSGWWNPANGPFEFCYAYDPGGRTSYAARRREWRVFDLLAPSLKLNADSENFPFSVKPDSLITLDKLVEVFKDYYEGTPYNFVKDITWVTSEGKTEISPMANPFMPYDMNKVFKINGGWGSLGERTIARWYTMYATITQSRAWLPDAVGGVVWLAWDNAATSVYTPIYCSAADVSESFKLDGRLTGYTPNSAWWAFNSMSMLAAQRWGDMRKDVTAAFLPIQRSLFDNQKKIEEEALRLLKISPEQAASFLTKYGIEWGDKAVARANALLGELMTKYDEKY